MDLKGKKLIVTRRVIIFLKSGREVNFDCTEAFADSILEGWQSGIDRLVSAEVSRLIIPAESIDYITVLAKEAPNAQK